MNRSLLLAALALSPGCLSLDFMFLDGAPTDAYHLDAALVPEALTEIVTFERDDGATLYGAWAHQETPSPPLIYFHGVGNNLETEWERVAAYWAWERYDVFIVDYGGFGRSEGEPSWEGLATMDGHATVAYVSQATGVPAEQIPWVALSLGGFVAIHTNDEVPAQAMVLQSVFANADALVDTSLQMDLPSGWFFDDNWDNVGAIPDISSPVLVIHGLADDFVLPESGPQLFEAAPGPDKALWQPEGVGHTDLITVAPEEFETRALAWFDQYAL